ncbi:MAG: hypothetical protein HY899_02390 [Deltaproteobacteria bacterium]|nr:hypothetical protein [Deltaproteobacteria bacterium]
MQTNRSSYLMRRLSCGLRCALALANVMISAAATPAWAKFCGDDVGGVRIACACGDVVVSDTLLQPSDPVVGERCSLDGLVVAPPVVADSITLDLDGLTISGAPYGVGIRVQGGGSGGAVIRGGGKQRDHAEVVGFLTGIESRMFGSIARIENLTVKGARRHGLSLRGRGILLVGVTASSNGGDGVHLVGQGGRLVGVGAFGNAGNGVVLLADGPVVEVDVENNGAHGVVVRGRGATLGEVRAVGNGGIGVLAPGVDEASAPRVVSERNGREDRRLRPQVAAARDGSGGARKPRQRAEGKAR